MIGNDDNRTFCYLSSISFRSVKGTIRIFLISKCFVSSDSFVLRERFPGQTRINLEMQAIRGRSFLFQFNQWKEVVHGVGHPIVNGMPTNFNHPRLTELYPRRYDEVKI